MSPEEARTMRAGQIIAAVVLAPAAVIAVGVAAVHASQGSGTPRAVPAVQTVTGQQGPAGGGGGGGGGSHTIARMVAGHVAYHLVPHPYLFHRPYIFRRSRRY